MLTRRDAILSGLAGTATLLLPMPSFALPENYERSLGHVLVHEGGYSNHPADPGGVTLNGIIQREYNAYRRSKGLPLRALTRRMLGTRDWIAERNEIYRRKYANPMAFDELPGGLDYSMFDYAVNSGIGRAPKVLQRILGVPASGRMDARTLAAIRQRDAKGLIRALNGERITFLHHLRTYRVFGPGWTRRVNSVRAISLLMADGHRASKFGILPAYGPGHAYDEEAMENLP